MTEPKEPTVEEMIGWLTRLEKVLEWFVLESKQPSDERDEKWRAMITAIRARISRKVSREWLTEKTKGVSVYIENAGGTAADPIRLNLDGHTWLIAMLKELGVEVGE